LGLRTSHKHGFGIQTTLPAPGGADFDLQMDFGVVERGYGWIFPQGDQLNVGLFTLERSIPSARRRLAAYCRARTGQSPGSPVRAGRIPYRGRFGPWQHGPHLYLVGDAAALVDPLLGEGIYNAVRSGQIAASAILDRVRGAPVTFARRFREIAADLASSDFDSHMFYDHLDRGYGHLCLWPVRHCLMKGTALGWTTRRIKRMCFLLPFTRPSQLRA
jgi:flavin-dependent dehydrogenase